MEVAGHDASFDVAIIGAGPAGATLAALLARRGVFVALIDRDRFPRDKVCGEFLSYDALPILERLGVVAELDAHTAPTIHECRVIGRSRTLSFPLPSPSRGVSRLLLDDLLFRTAISSGAADFSGWTAKQLVAGGLTVSRGGERRRIRAPIIAGAWGRWGRFDTELERSFIQDRTHRSFGFKRHYRRVAPDVAAGTIDLYSFDGGYLGVNEVEGGVTNICGLVAAPRLSGHKGRWDAFVELIRREEPPLERLYAAHAPAQDEFLTSEPVIFRARSAVEQGIFMAGDSSGVIDPLTGNGMAMAIQSALLLAPHLLEAISNRSRRNEIEDAYRKAHHRFFAPRIRWSRSIAALLSRPAMLDRALRLRSSRIGAMLVRRTRASEADVQRMCERWFVRSSS